MARNRMRTRAILKQLNRLSRTFTYTNIPPLHHRFRNPFLMLPIKALSVLLVLAMLLPCSLARQPLSTADRPQPASLHYRRQLASAAGSQGPPAGGLDNSASGDADVFTTDLWKSLPSTPSDDPAVLRQQCLVWQTRSAMRWYELTQKHCKGIIKAAGPASG